MTILEIIQEAFDELALERPTSAVNSTDLQVRQMLAYAREELRSLRRQYPWVQLMKDGSITLVGDQATYALPADFDRWLPDTAWDSNGLWLLDGPISPQEWQEWKHGKVGSTVQRRFRVRGYTNSQIFLDPTPAASEAGQVLYFEYMTKNIAQPHAWSTGALESAGRYTSYNGNFYVTASGGVTGSTPPTHTSGTVSDGGVSWTYYAGAYENFRDDNDTPILDSEIVKKGIKWRFKQKSGLSVDAEKAEYANDVKLAYVAMAGSRTVQMGRSRDVKLIDESYYPERNYGI